MADKSNHGKRKDLCFGKTTEISSGHDVGTSTSNDSQTLRSAGWCWNIVKGNYCWLARAGG